MATGDTAAQNDNYKTNSCVGYCEISQNFFPMHPEALMNGLNSLRGAGKLFDVALIVEGQTFKAHRVVLAACSDYFCAMFTTESMREASQFEIKLDGVNVRGFKLLLEYVYTSRLQLDRNNVQDVLSCSTHVQMKSVIDACSSYLESQIDLENCVAIASLADVYSLDILKKRSFRYICGRLSEFARTPELKSLTWDQIFYLLSCNCPVDCSEELVLDIILKYCFDTNLKSERIDQLLTQIRFRDISTCALDELSHKWSKLVHKDEKRLDHVPSHIVLYASMFSEQMKQRQDERSNDRLASKLHNVDESTSDMLTNYRGMELTLVKIGGFAPNGLTNEISCFIPSKGKWEVLTVIPHIEQCNYGTAVLGNDLYVVGGSYDVCLKEYIHPFGFRYCATKNKWSTMAPIQADRCRFSLNAMGKNFLYAVGGVCELNDHDENSDFRANGMISNCERYNVTTDKWEFLPALTENCSQHAGVVLREKLYISGGIDRHLVLSSLWCFDPKSNAWSKLASMRTPRIDHVLLAIDGFIYACGGWYEDPGTETRVLADTIDIYDAGSNIWFTVATNPMPKYYTGIAAIGKKIYFVGGLLSTTTIDRATSAVDCYDLKAEKWTVETDWEYPQEVWECTCTTFYVPSEREIIE